ncbi:MAG: hypothetical protein ABIK28_11625, partial [Planctomycetota bacterium]
MEFEPDYRQFEKVMQNQRPARLPLYEHIISPAVMETILGKPFAHLIEGDRSDIEEFFTHYCGFFKQMTYDVVTFEVCITEILPESGALSGGRPGPIQNRSDFEAYPWDRLCEKYDQYASHKFKALAKALPAGMKAVGGVGNGVFEISEDLVGLEYLPFMQADDPELYRDLHIRIGDLMVGIWRRFLRQHADRFVACRFGDDLGFKDSLLTHPATIRNHIVPQYKRVIDLIHDHGKPFLWHSCGCIFEIMEEVIGL